MTWEQWVGAAVEAEIRQRVAGKRPRIGTDCQASRWRRGLAKPLTAERVRGWARALGMDEGEAVAAWVGEGGR